MYYLLHGKWIHKVFKPLHSLLVNVHLGIHGSNTGRLIAGLFFICVSVMCAQAWPLKLLLTEHKSEVMTVASA